MDNILDSYLEQRERLAEHSRVAGVQVPLLKNATIRGRDWYKPVDAPELTLDVTVEVPFQRIRGQIRAAYLEQRECLAEHTGFRVQGLGLGV